MTEKELKKELSGIKIMLEKAMSAIPLAPNDRILNVAMVSDKTGLGKSTIYANQGNNGFPESVPLTEGRKGWRESDINAWIMNRDKVA